MVSSQAWEGHAELHQALEGLACAKGTSATRVKAVANAAFKYIKVRLSVDMRGKEGRSSSASLCAVAGVQCRPTHASGLLLTVGRSVCTCVLFIA